MTCRLTLLQTLGLIGFFESALSFWCYCYINGMVYGLINQWIFSLFPHYAKLEDGRRKNCFRATALVQ